MNDLKHLTDKENVLAKDINKLLSGNYVVVPILPTQEMISNATEIYYSSTRGVEAHILIANLWAMMVAQGVQS